MRAVVTSLVLFTLGACGSDPTPGGGDATSTGDTTVATDTTATPADSTATDTTTATETTATTTVTDTSTTETTPVTCDPVTLAGELAYLEEVSSPDEGYVAFIIEGEDLGFGTDLPDELWIELLGDLDQSGEIALGSGDNASYASCTECVSVVVDVDVENETYGYDLFQREGTLTIDPATPPSGLTLKATLTGLAFIEVTYDEETLESTPVRDGACYEIGTVTLETE